MAKLDEEDEDDEGLRPRRRASRERGSRPTLFRVLVYWPMTLALWGMIGFAIMIVGVVFLARTAPSFEAQPAPSGPPTSRLAPG